ncbi:MAG: GIY-YIG nuclease family protein [Lactobacillus iners]|nr:GIY-YIG nuclease family protein [Lactobacillus iners]MCT7818234.1 GIY-YIG nuclease family protein [Lactobacillus iners]
MEILKSNERIDYMYSDHLKVIQRKDAFSFSLDTLLLAYFAKEKIHDRDKVVDLCCGNGAATLYMSYFNLAHYDAVEIQPEIASQAKRSVSLNQLENRITVHCINALDAPKNLGKDKFDVVTVNPPYFKVPDGHRINPNQQKAIARHEILINLEQVIIVASQLLKMKGKLFIVHRPERLAEIIHYCLSNHMGVKNIQPFAPQKDHKTNLVVVEAVNNAPTDGLVLNNPIIVHNSDSSFTDEIENIIHENKAASSKTENKKYYFYCLQCADGSFYGGFTDNLKKRIEAHNAGKGAKYTKIRRPVKLLYFEEFADKRAALKREYWFKHHDRKWKENFLTEHNVKF